MSKFFRTFAPANQNQTIMKTKLLLLSTLVALLASCNPDVQLYDYEDTPKVEEHILGLTKSEAEKYLAKKGFIFGHKMDYVDEFVYSKDKKIAEFSYDASIMLMFGTFEDTVRYVSATQCMQTQKSAYDLYWKWSHYTASVTLPKYTYWSGYAGSGYYNAGEQEQFWAEYKENEDNLKTAFEHYKNEGVQPKEIELSVYMNNGGRIELNYDTHNSIIIWE